MRASHAISGENATPARLASFDWSIKQKIPCDCGAAQGIPSSLIPALLGQPPRSRLGDFRQLAAPIPPAPAVANPHLATEMARAPTPLGSWRPTARPTRTPAWSV